MAQAGYQAGLTNLTNLTNLKLPPAAPPAKPSATNLTPPAPALSLAGAPAVVAESPTRLNLEPIKESRLLRQVRALLEGTRGRTSGGPAGGPPSSRGCTLDGLCAALSLEPDEAKRILHQHRIEKLLVVDEAYRCTGLVTVKDIEKSQQHPTAVKDEKGRLRVGAATGTEVDDHVDGTRGEFLVLCLHWCRDQ
jgi:hypothetical protein